MAEITSHFKIPDGIRKHLTDWLDGQGTHPAFEPKAFQTALDNALAEAAVVYETVFKRVFSERYSQLRSR